MASTFRSLGVNKCVTSSRMPARNAFLVCVLNSLLIGWSTARPEGVQTSLWSWPFSAQVLSLVTSTLRRLDVVPVLLCICSEWLHPELVAAAMARRLPACTGCFEVPAFWERLNRYLSADFVCSEVVPLFELFLTLHILHLGGAFATEIVSESPGQLV